MLKLTRKNKTDKATQRCIRIAFYHALRAISQRKENSKADKLSSIVKPKILIKAKRSLTTKVSLTINQHCCRGYLQQFEVS